MPPEAGISDAQADASNPPSNSGRMPKLGGATAAWLVLFTLGGGLLALYYSGIEYFPEFIWQDALTSLALMTIVGGGLLLAYGFLLFVPGAIWSKFLICDEELHEVFWMAHRRSEHCVWAVTKHIVVPFAVFMVFLHALFLPHFKNAGFVALGATASLMAVSVFLAKDLREALSKKGERLGWHRAHVLGLHVPLVIVTIIQTCSSYCFFPTTLWLLALLPWASVAIFSILAFSDWRRKRRNNTSGLQDDWSLLCRATLAFASAALLSLAAIWFFYRVYSSGASLSPGDELGLLLLCTVAVILANLIVSVLFRNQRSLARFVSFLVALVLLGAGHLLGTEQHATLPAKIMANFGFGGQPATLVLTERGGRILCQHASIDKVKLDLTFENPAAPKTPTYCSNHQTRFIVVTPQTAQKVTKPDGPLARVTGLTILSRLGSEYLLRIDNGPTFAFPKEEIVSWSVESQHQEANESYCQVEPEPAQK